MQAGIEGGGGYVRGRCYVMFTPSSYQTGIDGNIDRSGMSCFKGRGLTVAKKSQPDNKRKTDCLCLFESLSDSWQVIMRRRCWRQLNYQEQAP